MAPSVQSNFPVLIQITDQSNPIFDRAQSTGNDIYFTLSDGITKLDHEIEYYKNTTTKELDAWVRIPTLSSSTDTIIYMYYGNSSALNQENPTGVWDSNFTTIQHLNETSGEHSDSTSNGSNSTVVNVTPQGSASGQINGADGFDGIDDQVRLNVRFTFGTPPPTPLITDTTGTIEAWVKPTGSPASEPTDVWELPPVVADLGGGLAIHRGSLGGQDRIWVYNWDDDQDVIGISYSVDEWVHIVWVHENGNLHAYKNGQEVAGSPISSGNTWGNFMILGTSNVSSNSFNGLIDEVRTSNVDRSADWILTSFRNQDSPGTYLTFGNEEVF